MRHKLFTLIKAILPDCLVEKIHAHRVEKRNKDRMNLNGGKPFEYKVKSEGEEFTIILDPVQNAGADDYIYRDGVWEPEVSRVIKKYLKLDAVFLDIGANIGYHSLFAAKIVGSGGSVLSFEPIPRLAEQIKSSAELNSLKNIQVHTVALSDTLGTATLSLIDENISASSLKSYNKESLVAGTLEVELDLLDNYLPQLKSLDLIKIDVEGNEFESLRGGEKMLKQFLPIIIMEFSRGRYELEEKGKAKKFVDWLTYLGYGLYTLDGILIDVEIMLQQKFEYQDIICIPLANASN